jgi:hypothetical protein
VDSNDLERLRAGKLELLRLRGAIGDLRRASSASKGTIEEQIAGNTEAAAVARQTADLLKARMEARDVAQETSTVISTLGAIVRVVAVVNNGVVPATWDEVRNRLEQPWPPQPGKSAEQTEQRRQALLDMFQGTARGSIKPVMFQLLPVPPSTFQNDHREPGRQVLLLREQTPRRQPDGGWARAYAFSSGGVQEAQSADGDFSRWEKEAVQP